MREARVSTPAQVDEAARLIVTHGRWWLDLDDDLIARGAKAVTNSPQYRAEVYASARNRWRDLGRPQPLGDLLIMAEDALSHNDATRAETEAAIGRGRGLAEKYRRNEV